MRRFLLVVVAFLTLGVASTAQAKPVDFSPCDQDLGATCGRVSVPLDWLGQQPGKLGLFVKRVPATRRARRGPLFVFLGGPGQAPTPLAAALADALAPALRDRELVLVDPRGTGRSGRLKCPELERSLKAGRKGSLERQGAQCARRLGTRRALYATTDSVNDTEAVRRAIGASRVSLLGVSAGTPVAEAYAARHPDRVESLILDSPILPWAVDPFELSAFAALRRVVGSLCSARRCRGITNDALHDLSQLARRLAKKPIRGSITARDGSRKRVSLNGRDLLNTVVALDQDASLLEYLPAALQSALRGSSLRLLRLRAQAAALADPGAPDSFSAALFAVATCEHGAVAWNRRSGAKERKREAAKQAEGLPSNAFAPFDRATVVDLDNLGPCVGWPPPAAGRTTASVILDWGLFLGREIPGGLRAPQVRRFASYAITAVPFLLRGEFDPLVKLPVSLPPDVPTLIVSGEDDIRTPTEDAVRLARLFPRASLVVAPESGHSVLSDPPACVRRALGRFMEGRDPRGCSARGRQRRARVEPVAPVGD